MDENKSPSHNILMKYIISQRRENMNNIILLRKRNDLKMKEKTLKQTYS